MYTFNRTVTINSGVNTPKAVGFSVELTGYLNKTYGLNLRCGMELFNKSTIHWQFDVDGLDKIAAINQRLLEDKSYWAMLEKGKEYWVEGSQRDTIVTLFK
jgi:hypothetical protein